jgi:hypothetical protein
MAQREGEFSYKVVLVGSTGTGKTQLLRLLEKGAPHGWEVHRFDHNGRDGVVFQHLPLKTPKLLAVAASSHWRERGTNPSDGNKRTFRKAEGAILVFSWEEPKTFDELTDWLQVYQENAQDSRILFMVGTHHPPTKDSGEYRRKVEAFKERAGICEYYEMANPDPIQTGRIFKRITEQLAPAGATTRDFLTTRPEGRAVKLH